MFDPELESFKHIDLRAYALSLGYTIDKRDSWSGSTVMRHSSGDKIIISREPDGHYVYYSVRSDADNGTIIDFIQQRKGLSLGGIRKELRDWSGISPDASPSLPELASTIKDRQAVQDRYASMRVAHRHAYLEQQRGIPPLALQYWRFDGRIKVDRPHENAVFPHYDDEGLCGYELKNYGFTGFAAGGTKGLWLSKAGLEDRRLVICESAIDALSHAVVVSDGHARYASIGGKLNPLQPDLIVTQIKRMQEGSEIVAAMDADGPGRQLAAIVRKAFDASGRVDLKFRLDEPAGFKDWNDQLRGKHTHSVPAMRCQEPSVA